MFRSERECEKLQRKENNDWQGDKMAESMPQTQSHSDGKETQAECNNRLQTRGTQKESCNYVKLPDHPLKLSSSKGKGKFMK